MSFYGQPQYSGTQQQGVGPIQNSPYPGFPQQTQGGPLPYPQSFPHGGSVPYPQQGSVGFPVQGGGPAPYTAPPSFTSSHYQPNQGTSPYPQQGLGYGQSWSQGTPAPYPQQGTASYQQPPNQYTAQSQQQGSAYNPQYQSQPASGSSHFQPGTMSDPPRRTPPPRPSQPPSRPADSQSGYPTGQNQPGYPTGQNQPGYPTGQNPAGANQPGYSTGANQPGYPTGPNPNGYPTGPNPTGQNQPGYPTGPNQPGYPTGPSQPGYPTGPNQQGQPQGTPTAYTQAAGPTVGNQPGYPQGGNQAGYPQGGQQGYGAPQSGYPGQQGGQPGGPPPQSSPRPQSGQPGYGGPPAQSGQTGYGGQPGYGGPPPQSGQPGYGGPPAQSGQPGYGGPPPQSGQPGYGGPPPQSGQPGYGGPPAQSGQPGYGGPPPQSGQPGYGGPPAQSGQPGYGGPPPQSGQPGYGGPPPQSGQPGYGGPPPQSGQPGYGGPPPQSGQPGYGGPPPQSGQPGYGGPPSQSGYPGQQGGQQPAYGGPPAQSGHPGQQGGYNPAAPTPQAYGGATGSGGHLPARPPGQDQFASKVELRLECHNLLNLDVMSKSDPCAVLYMQRAGKYEEVGRTENVKNCLDPRFSRAFSVSYYFEEVQKLMICVYDIDNATPELSDDDFLGQIETTLGQLVSNAPYTKPLVLRSGKRAGNGTITVRAEELKEGTERVAMTFHAKKLDKKDFLGKSDPYLEVQKATSDGSWQVVHRTEVVKNNLNPSWRSFELPMSTLCNSNKTQNIKFDVYDWDNDGSHDYIGGFTATLEEMLKASQSEVSWPCINPTKKAKKKSYTNSGIVLLSSCKLVKTYTFLDYIFGGMQINFTVGIDFTGSNGHPSKPTSLHYINPNQPNEYMQAIRAVGDVCQDYDSDKMFPALGFGAKIPPRSEVMHEFAINFNPQNPFCAGIDGVLGAYFNCIQRVELYGPTNAAPIIRHVANFAAEAQREEPKKGAHAYSVLLMLTDGVLSDMSDTRHAVVAASRLPMSLIIVGVGNADFSDMNMLDGDDGTLKAPNGEPAKRDIVQFVPFRDFKRTSPAELARVVLAEVPKQITDYYKMRGMQPNKRVPATQPPA